MATIVMQRDLVITLKKETTSNVSILSKLQNMSSELSRLVFKENALEKPTQNLFNQLSYYLLSIIDENASASLTWPLYDTKGERAFRSELASFISDYSSKGLLAPVMSSYLVNPGCFKVTVLLFQLSQLAVNRMVLEKMEKDNQKKLYNEMTAKYKSQQKEGFVESIDKETHMVLTKFSNYLLKRRIMEQIAELFRKKISKMETLLANLKAQNYIDNVVDGFINKYEFDDETKFELSKIKNVNDNSKLFDAWLAHTDTTIDIMEKTWDSKVKTLLQSSQTLYQLTQILIAKGTGECDRSEYTVEYSHKNDEICTKELQNQVNSEQKYVLRNLQKDGQLNFPNLVRAFVISICFILKHNGIGDEIYNLNEYMESGRRNYSEIVSAMRILIDRMLNAETKLQPAIEPYNYSVSMKELPEIPPLPNLSNLKTSRDCNQVLFETFTPLNMTKFHFNLRRKANGALFAKPQPRSLITPFHAAPRDDFLKSIISCRISTYDRQSSQESHDLSIISNANRANETIAECSSGFTKQQILRLLSTKKTSSSKKFKYNTTRPNIEVKKGGLFNESARSNDSNGLFRSYSSPNLFENKEKRSYSRGRGRQLSIMREDSPLSILEMSGIAALDGDINYSTPQDFAESSRKFIDTSSLPVMTIPSDAEKKINNVLNAELSLDKEMGMNSIVSPILDETRKSVEIEENNEARNDTPRTNNQLIRKTSSLEKIINRFKKLRANIVPEKKEESTECKTIIEEKENIKTVNFEVFTANRILLPDLLSASCNSVSIKSDINTDYLDEICNEMDELESRKPRQSLGTALGVDQTFLDQFDLID